MTGTGLHIARLASHNIAAAAFGKSNARQRCTRPHQTSGSVYISAQSLQEWRSCATCKLYTHALTAVVSRWCLRPSRPFTLAAPSRLARAQVMAEEGRPPLESYSRYCCLGMQPKRTHVFRRHKPVVWKCLIWLSVLTGAGRVFLLLATRHPLIGRSITHQRHNFSGIAYSEHESVKDAQSVASVRLRCD